MLCYIPYIGILSSKCKLNINLEISLKKVNTNLILKPKMPLNIKNEVQRRLTYVLLYYIKNFLCSDSRIVLLHPITISIAPRMTQTASG